MKFIYLLSFSCLFAWQLPAQCLTSYQKVIPDEYKNPLSVAYGHSVDVYDDIAVVTIPSSDSLHARAGLAFVYQYDGSQWQKIATLTPSNPEPNLRFGDRVIINEDIIFIVAYKFSFAVPKTNGGIYVFHKPAGGWQDMTETALLYPPEGTNLYGINFNVNSNSTTAAFIYNKKVYVYTRTTEQWQTTAHPQVLDFSNQEYYLEDIAIEGNVMALAGRTSLSETKIMFYKSDNNLWNDAQLINEIEKTSDQYYYFGLQLRMKGQYLLAYTFSYENDFVFLLKSTDHWQSIDNEVILTSGQQVRNGGFSDDINMDMDDQGIVISRISKSLGHEVISYYQKPAGDWQDSEETFFYAIENPTIRYSTSPLAISGNHIVFPRRSTIYAQQDEVHFLSITTNAIEFRQKFSHQEYNASHMAFSKNMIVENDAMAVYALRNEESTAVYDGVIYLYEKNPLNDEWMLVNQLHPPDKNNSINFGHRMIFHGEYLLVGATLARDANDRQVGAAYLFKKTGESWSNLDYIAKFTPSLSSYQDDSDQGHWLSFGSSLVMTNDLIAIGMPFRDFFDGYYQQDGGVIYIYEKDEAAEWQSAEETAILSPSQFKNNQRLGESLAYHDETLFSTSAHAGMSGKGVVYAFERPAAGYKDTTESYQITVDTYSNSYFGLIRGIIKFQKDLMFVGNPLADVQGKNNAGNILVLRKHDSGWKDAEHLASISAQAPLENAQIGSVYDLHNNILIAGNSDVYGSSYLPATERKGLVIVFQALDYDWQETIELIKIQGDRNYPIDAFGTSVACNGDDLLIGAQRDDTPSGYQSGAVYHIKMPPSLQLMPPVCPTDEAVDLIAYPQGGDWSGPGIQHKNENRFYPSLAGFGEHIITYKTENCYYDGKLKIAVGQEQKPIIKALDNPYLCDHEIVKLEIQSLGTDPVQENHTFTWERYSENNQFISTYTSSLPFYEVQYPGKYVIKTDTACNVPSDTIDIQALPNNLEIEPLPVICDPSQPVPLKASPENGTWNSAHVNNHTLTPGNMNPGIHYLRYQVSREGACNYSDSLKVIIDPVEKPETELAAENCSKQGTALFFNNKNTSHTLELYDPDVSQFVITDSTLLNEFYLTSPGQYRLTGYKHNCSSTANPFDFFPAFELEMPDEPNLLLCQNSPPILQAEQDEEVKYHWQHFRQDGWQVVNHDFSASGYTITDPGTYRLEAVRNHCNFTSDTYEAEIALSDSMFIPNVVTPNNDGLNDRLELYFNNDLPQHLTILNRWGQVIYENRQYSGSWPEEEIRSGIYYYQLRYQTPCYPNPAPLNGWVQVIGAGDWP